MKLQPIKSTSKIIKITKKLLSLNWFKKTH